ncbi:MAG: hypothetical protein AABX47_04080 [Nanoarchaeota archaeon]
MAKKSSSRRSVAPRRGRTETGQGMSISTIIVAAIGLIVLVVLVAIFTGQMGKWTSGVEKEKTGLTCIDASPKGLGGSWQADPCPLGKQLLGVSNPDDVRTHAGQNCCAK